MGNIIDDREFKDALKSLIITECDADLEIADINDGEILIGGELSLDSLDALQISMAVQSEYGVRIEGGPAARSALRSINALAETIRAATAH